MFYYNPILLNLQEKNENFDSKLKRIGNICDQGPLTVS